MASLKDYLRVKGWANLHTKRIYIIITNRDKKLNSERAQFTKNRAPLGGKLGEN